MKHLFHFQKFLTLHTLIFVLLVAFSACDTTKNVTNNTKNNGHLDPVVAKNTNPKDTAQSGTYTPVTSVGTDGNDPRPTPKIDTVTWCDTIQETAFKQIVVCFEKVGTNAPTTDTVDVIEINRDALYSSTTVDSTIEQKLAYKVVVLMPFMSKNFVPTPVKEVPSRSIKAVEFYEGVRMALDSLQEEGVSLFVNVFDSQRDTNIVKQLLQQRELQEADLIIGPVTSNNLRLVADFAKNNETTLISPFNTRTDITTDNPYYIQVAPSFKVHSDYIVDHIHKIEPNPIIRTPMEKNMMILGLTRDSARIAQIQESYAAYKNDINASIPALIRENASIDIDAIRPYLQRDKLNIIVMPTYQNEGFVYNSLREIQTLVDKVEPRKGYQIAIVGMNRWKYYNRINFEYFESMNLHLSSPYFANTTEVNVQRFRNDYKALYGIGIREFGFMGYDMMLYFGRMIHKYGVNFPAHLWKENAQYLHTKFQIQPSYEQLAPLDAGNNQNQSTVLRGYENYYLNFLEFKNYKLQKVNE